jgi:predicted dehydrogenase
MDRLRFAMCGAGFWARYQLAGWKETGAECVAICNRTRKSAEALAGEFGVPAVYDSFDELVQRELLDFVDVVTAVEAHSSMVELAARYRVPVVCQKPMARTLQEAERMVSVCRDAGVPLLINENWRWQEPIRALKAVLASGAIGTPFRARIDMITGFPVFRNQPFLGELDQFIIADLGSHLLDVARFLFGEADAVTCHTRRVHPDICGEDVATIMLKMQTGATVLVEMAYAENYLERDHYPETFVFVEGDKGSAEIAPDYQVRVTTVGGTRAQRHPPTQYPWALPALAPVHASIVPCQANLVAALRGKQEAETTGVDNLKTVRLVFGAYESAQTGETIRFTASAREAA